MSPSISTRPAKISVIHTLASSRPRFPRQSRGSWNRVLHYCCSTIICKSVQVRLLKVCGKCLYCTVCCSCIESHKLLHLVFALTVIISAACCQKETICLLHLRSQNFRNASNFLFISGELSYFAFVYKTVLSVIFIKVNNVIISCLLKGVLNHPSS